MGKAKNLLASAPSLKDLVPLIERYWYSRPGSIVLLKTGVTTWGIWQSDVEMIEFRVRQSGVRFRFEAKETTETKGTGNE